MRRSGLILLVVLAIVLAAVLGFATGVQVGAQVQRFGRCQQLSNQYAAALAGGRNVGPTHDAYARECG